MRRLSLPAHETVELAVGLGLGAGAFTLDVGPAAMVALVAAAVVLAGMGLGGGESLTLAAHEELDRSFATVLAAVGAVMALSGEPTAAALLVGAAACMIVLVAGTRWTRSVAH